MDKSFQEWAEQRKGNFSPLVPYTTGDILLPLDFTQDNLQLTDRILEDTALFTAYIKGSLAEAGARYGVGGYNEHRTVYSRSTVFDGEPGTEPRRLHLGIDIWGAAATPVFAPLEGKVHSVGFHETLGNYGAVIILQHEVDGLQFHTLYGHLSLDSIRNKKEGQPIGAGEQLAEFGVPEENGYWPPHLHFQVILDLQGWKGDYPGVCRFSERRLYLSNCPDPAPLMPW